MATFPLASNRRRQGAHVSIEVDQVRSLRGYGDRTEVVLLDGQHHHLSLPLPAVIAALAPVFRGAAPIEGSAEGSAEALLRLMFGVLRSRHPDHLDVDALNAGVLAKFEAEADHE